MLERCRRGFTLIELLIALAVIGIIAAIAIPNLLNALQRGRQKRTMGDMRAIGSAVQAYSIDADEYVVQEPEGTIRDVGNVIEPTYIAVLPDHDAWASDYRYQASERAYDITSYGKDRSLGGGGAVSDAGTTTDFANDIVFSTGSFAQYPEGSQR